ncbi:DNA methyltransferase [Aeromonas veronii]|uniref:DNA methyltransferase n=1 Tax=Aeromonas veronii TaxID=654 RepID=UPI0038D9D0CA
MSSAGRSKRRENDFYPSPEWTVKVLLKRLKLRPDDVFLEPARGDSAIYDLVALESKKWAELSMGVDYLNNDLDLSADVIITNPPYLLLEEFIKTAIDRDLKPRGTVAMLLRLNALGGHIRYEFWSLYPPTHTLTLTPRPTFTGGGTDSSEYAWFIWDYGGRYLDRPIAVASRTEVDPTYKPRKVVKKVPTFKATSEVVV